MNLYKIVKVNIEAGNMDHQLPEGYNVAGTLTITDNYIVLLCTKWEPDTTQQEEVTIGDGTFRVNNAGTWGTAIIAQPTATPARRGI